MDYELLTNIIEAFKQYQLSIPNNKKTSLVDFSTWITRQEYQKLSSANLNMLDIIGENDVEIELGKLIIFMNRYTRLLIKKGLSDFPQLINEDVTYVYAMMEDESLTKTQLIDKNIHEKPTGLEVIKRLIKNGYVEESADEKDKRSKRVTLTEKGKQIFFGTIPQMRKVSKIVCGKLTSNEKKQLFTLLKKLEDFHNPIFLEERYAGLDDLMAKLL
jgi:DNA-binding MarR family transcriptional regulator